MAVSSKTESIILDLLEYRAAMGIDDIFHELAQQQEPEFSERVVKETIWKLLEEGKLKPNREWKMELNLQ
jgi:hypothetical protein